MSAAGWYSDPSGRHQYRYFDGTDWTEHVGDDDVQSVDALPSQTGQAAVNSQMQPSSKTVLWEGRKDSLSSAATGGKVVSARYVITEDAIIFEAGLMSSREETVPLWAVMDVDLHQSLVQKRRNVGDLSVRIDPAGSKYGHRMIKLESIRDPRTVRDLLARQANMMRHAMLDYHHNRDLERRRAGASSISVGSTAPAQPTEDSSKVSKERTADVMSQLRQLGGLRDAGILTDEEFEGKKTELLRRL